MPTQGRFFMKKLVKKCFVTTLPVMAGYLFLGTGFGMLLQSKGYGILWSVAMSGLIYAGSMQDLAIDLLCGGASLITAAVTTLMVNARHVFYGISMIDTYQDTGAYKPYLIFALTDETYSLNCGGGAAAPLEAQYAAQHRRRHRFLHDTCAIGVLNCYRRGSAQGSPV